MMQLKYLKVRNSRTISVWMHILEDEKTREKKRVVLYRYPIYLNFKVNYLLVL